MAQPPAYVPAHSFVTDSATLANFPGQALDVEFNDVKATTDAIRTNLALIQRDDGALANGGVGYDQLSASLQTNGISPALPWVTATAYAVGNAVTINSNLYRCLVAHTSGTFATDLAAAKWVFVAALPTGATGAAGTNGTNSGLAYTFETSTTMALPATGALRLNNATLASATAIAFNVLNADTGNPSVATTLLTFDDSTTTAHRGVIILRKVSAPQNYVIFDITGAITDNTTWQQHTVTYLNGNGSFSASDALSVTWARTGDAGSGTISGATNHGVAIATGASSVTSTAVMTNGQLLVGQSGADPLPKTISGDGTMSSAGALTVTSINGVAATLGGAFVTSAALTMTASAASAVFFDNIPQNSKSAAYTTVLADAQKHIFHPSADTTARTFTIDSNANVPYPIGTAITFINQHSAGVVTIAITSDTMRFAGSGVTGSRSLAADGIATAIKVTSTEWIISGTGLS